MTTHNLWLDLMLEPHKLTKEHLSSITENETFDLLVHLINNGSNLLASINSNISEDTKKSVENRKYCIIRLLVFKLLAHFKWDLHKIVSTLPSIHQDFAFNEVQKLFDQEPDVPEEWKNFFFFLYHRWVMHQVLKTMYPSKSQKIGANNSNQHLLDPYFVAPDVQESLNKKLQSICMNSSLKAIQETTTELEAGKRMFEVSMPHFDCFLFDENNPKKIKFVRSKAQPIALDCLLDDVFFELGKWFFTHEDYTKASNYFAKIKNTKINSFTHLEGYKLASQVLLSNKRKMTKEPKVEPSESGEVRLRKYLNRLIHEKENNFDRVDMNATDYRVMVRALKTFHDSCQNKEEALLFARLSKYLIFQINGLRENLDANSKSLFLKVDKSGADETEGMIEEGEINADEELNTEEEPELMIMEAIEPELILRLIPSIKKAPLSINRNWRLPDHLRAVIEKNPADYTKCHLMLAKAYELRKANYFAESRALYLSLMEDNQTSNPLLANVIRYELLHTDLENFFTVGITDQRTVAELETRCLQLLDNSNLQHFPFFSETIESVCVFLLDNSLASLRELANSSYEIVRFCSCLSILSSSIDTGAGAATAAKVKEFWESCLSSCLPANAKLIPNHPRVHFYSSFESFISRLCNVKVVSVIAACLLRIYRDLKDNTLQLISIHPQFEYLSTPNHLLNMLDQRAMSQLLERTLRCYLRCNPNDSTLLKYYGEYLLAEGLYFKAFEYFVRIVLLNTNYFVRFDYLDANEPLVQQMITCSMKMACHIQAAVLQQLSREPDYGLAFKELSQMISCDSSDELYDCIWDVTLLEYLINYHQRRGDDERRLKVTKLISQLDLNIHNDAALLAEASTLRKTKLFRMLAKQYLDT